MKDKTARREGRLTVMALANVVAAIVDTMCEADVPNDVTRRFLDRLDQLNGFTLQGVPLHIMHDVIDIVRSTVPGND